MKNQLHPLLAQAKNCVLLIELHVRNGNREEAVKALAQGYAAVNGLAEIPVEEYGAEDEHWDKELFSLQVRHGLFL